MEPHTCKAQVDNILKTRTLPLLAQINQNSERLSRALRLLGQLATKCNGILSKTQGQRTATAPHRRSAPVRRTHPPIKTEDTDNRERNAILGKNKRDELKGTGTREEPRKRKIAENNGKREQQQDAQLGKTATREEKTPKTREEHKKHPGDSQEIPGKPTLPTLQSPPLTLEEITSQLSDMTATHSEETLLSCKAFELSVGAKSALGLLHSLGEDKFYLHSPPPPDVVWAYRLFFQFLKQTLPSSPEEAWDICREFLRGARNRGLQKKTMEEVFADSLQQVDFEDNENIDKVEKLIAENRHLLNPQHYTAFCAMTGLIVFGLKDAAVYAAAVDGKTPPFMKCRRLLYKKQLIEQNSS